MPGEGPAPEGVGGLAGGLGGIFGDGAVAEQLFVWGVLQQVLIAIITPGLDLLTQFVQSGSGTAILTPEQAAALVARYHLPPADGASEALGSGVNADRFKLLVDAAYTPPAAGDVIEAMRRGLTGWDRGGATMPSVLSALQLAGVNPEWVDLYRQLATSIPTVQEVMNAWLEGQITEDEARERYSKAGGDPTWFQTSYNAQGQAPTPVQALELLNRGIIPQDGTGPDSISYQQAFLEGPWRNKWLGPFLALRDYLPPPRTVVAMVRTGSLTDDQAMDLLVKQGLTHDLATAYVSDAHSTASKSDRDLTESQVVTLYSDQLVTADDAAGMLATLGYGPDNARYILAMADLRRAITALDSSISRVQSLYVGHKITRATAVASLNSLHVPAAQVTAIVADWDITAAANVKVLTESQVVDAWAAGIIDQSEAEAELTGMGYTPRDAWILLSLKHKSPLPGEPPAGPAPAR